MNHRDQATTYDIPPALRGVVEKYADMMIPNPSPATLFVAAADAEPLHPLSWAVGARHAEPVDEVLAAAAAAHPIEPPDPAEFERLLREKYEPLVSAEDYARLRAMCGLGAVIDGAVCEGRAAITGGRA